MGREDKAMKMNLEKIEIDFKKETASITFSKFNYFYGQMGSGKSSIARLIDYCLGGELDMTPALQNEFSTACLYLKINDTILSLERSIGSNQLIASWERDDEDYKIVIPARKSDGVVIPETEVEVVSDLIYHIAGYVPPKVRKSKIKEDTDLKRLSFRNLLWYCYLDQDNIDNTLFHLDKDANPYKRLDSKDVLRFIIGFHQEIVAQLEMEVQEKNDKKRELKSAAKALKEAIESTGIKSVDEIQKMVSSLQGEKKIISTEIEEIKKNDPTLRIPHGIETLRDTARKIDIELNAIETGILELNQQIEKDESYLHEITMLNVKNKRSVSARAVLFDVDFENCPRCAQKLPQRNEFHCTLCGQEEVLSDEEAQGTISEPAMLGEFDEISEHEIDSVFGLPEPERADSGRVEDQAGIIGKTDELAGSGRVTPLGITRPHLPHLEAFLADERVHDR